MFVHSQFLGLKQDARAKYKLYLCCSYLSVALCHHHFLTFRLFSEKDSSMPKKLIEIASEIVQTQVSLTSMTATDIAASLRQVFSTLHELQKAEAGEIELPKTQESPPHQTLTPQDSIHDDKVICLECRKEMRLITGRHLSLHGISPKEYKKKYGLTMRIPLSAKSLIKARSKAAKKKGLPEKLIQ